MGALKNILLFISCCNCLIAQGAAAHTVFYGNKATNVQSKYFSNPAELLSYSATTGESVILEVAASDQTIVTQHHVNVQLNCNSLLRFAKIGTNISWTKVYGLSNKGDGQFLNISEQSIPNLFSINGSRNSILNFVTDVHNSAGESILTSGIFRCTSCGGSGCVSRDVTVLIIGGPPIIGSREGESAPSDHYHFEVGHDSCFEKPESVNEFMQLTLECPTLNSIENRAMNLSPAYPDPKVTWMFDGKTVFENNFFTEDYLDEGMKLFSEAFLLPQFVSTRDEGHSLEFTFETRNATLISILEISLDEVYRFLVGSWTCIQSNPYGNASATINLSHCEVISGLLSFETKQIVASESDVSIEVCVQSFLMHDERGVNRFHIYTSDSDAKATMDYVRVDVNSTIVSGFTECFQIQLRDDEISEPVETFKLHLNKSFSEDALSFINRTLTVVVTDDDHVDTAEEPTCTIGEYFLVDEIKEETEKTVETIVSVLPLRISIASDAEEITEEVYEQLAEVFNQNVSPEGQDRFIAATNEINSAYVDECSKTVSHSQRGNITRLAAKFKELTNPANGITSEKLREARTLYGKFLCYYGEEGELHRARRQAEDCDYEFDYGSSDYSGGIVQPTPCACPETVTEPCHFFACISITETRFIIGFGQIVNFNSEPCIGFAIDTTGSMGAEIESAKRVIRTFLKSQADATICYLLVPFNDYSDYDDERDHVGPIAHAITDHQNTEVALASLKNFEVAVDNLYAHQGGDTPEYAYSAMLEALRYSFIDEYGCDLTPMHEHSELIVITDAPSKLPELKPIVIEQAKEQGVTIHFILSYPIPTYDEVASETGGIVHNNFSTWHLVNQHFHRELGGTERKKRSPSLTTSISVNVSVFTNLLKVSTLTLTHSSGIATLTLPNKTVENVEIEDSVMIFLKTYPLAGSYYFNVGAHIDSELIEQDVSLDVRMLYTDKNLTAYSSNPSSACTSGKLVVTTSKIREILSLSLKETDASNSTRLISLTKCSNAFIADYQFGAPKIVRYDVEGVDILGIKFTFDMNKIAIINSSSTEDVFSLQSTNSTGIVMEYSGSFSMTFKLISYEVIGTSNFTLSARANGFNTVLSPLSINLQPTQTKTITLNGTVGSVSIGGGTTHNITLIASNGCVDLTASRSVTVKAMPAPRPTESTTNECGCENGGTCVVLTRRGRVLRRCRCTPEYRGSRCQRRRST